jgi:hypothetical protein
VILKSAAEVSPRALELKRAIEKKTAKAAPVRRSGFKAGEFDGRVEDPAVFVLEERPATRPHPSTSLLVHIEKNRYVEEGWGKPY